MSEALSLFRGVVHVPRSMREILADVATRHGLTLDELKGPSHARRIAHPRQQAMWLMRQEHWASGGQRYSLPQIGEFLGGRDHTTVLHGVRKYEQRRSEVAA